MLSYYIYKYFSQHLGSASLSFPNHMKGCQLASKFTTWCNSFRDLVTLWVCCIALEGGRCIAKWINERSAPRWLHSSIDRALHWYRRGHGFKSRSGLNFFQALISQLLKLCLELRWSIINFYLSPQFKYMIIHIFICIVIFYCSLNSC